MSTGSAIKSELFMPKGTNCPGCDCGGQCLRQIYCCLQDLQWGGSWLAPEGRLAGDAPRGRIALVNWTIENGCLEDDTGASTVSLDYSNHQRISDDATGAGDGGTTRIVSFDQCYFGVSDLSRIHNDVFCPCDSGKPNFTVRLKICNFEQPGANGAPPRFQVPRRITLSEYGLRILCGGNTSLTQRPHGLVNTPQRGVWGVNDGIGVPGVGVPEIILGPGETSPELVLEYGPAPVGSCLVVCLTPPVPQTTTGGVTADCPAPRLPNTAPCYRTLSCLQLPAAGASVPQPEIASCLDAACCNCGCVPNPNTGICNCGCTEPGGVKLRHRCGPFKVPIPSTGGFLNRTFRVCFGANIGLAGEPVNVAYCWRKPQDGDPQFMPFITSSLNHSTTFAQTIWGIDLTWLARTQGGQIVVGRNRFTISRAFGGPQDAEARLISRTCAFHTVTIQYDAGEDITMTIDGVTESVVSQFTANGLDPQLFFGVAPLPVWQADITPDACYYGSLPVHNPKPEPIGITVTP